MDTKLNREDVIQALSDAILALPEGECRSTLKQLRLGVTYRTFGPFGNLQTPKPCNGEQPLPYTIHPVEDLCESYTPAERNKIDPNRKKLGPVVAYLEHVHGCPKVVE